MRLSGLGLGLVYGVSKVSVSVSVSSMGIPESQWSRIRDFKSLSISLNFKNLVSAVSGCNEAEHWGFPELFVILGLLNQPIPFDRFMNAQKRNGRVEYLNRSNTLVYSTLKSKERLVCVCFDLVHFGPHNKDKIKHIRKLLIFLLSHLC